MQFGKESIIIDTNSDERYDEYNQIIKFVNTDEYSILVVLNPSDIFESFLKNEKYEAYDSLIYSYNFIEDFTNKEKIEGIKVYKKYKKN